MRAQTPVAIETSEEKITTVSNVTGCALSEQALHFLILLLAARPIEYCQVTYVEAESERMGSREQKAHALFSNFPLWLCPRLIVSMSFPSKTPCSCLMSAATTLTQSAFQCAEPSIDELTTHLACKSWNISTLWYSANVDWSALLLSVLSAALDSSPPPRIGAR